MRGLASDYDHWRQLGNGGWSWDDVLPFFRKAERNQRGADDLHGGEGPQGVSDAIWHTPLADAYIAACRQAGIPANADFNGRVAGGRGLLPAHRLARPPGLGGQGLPEAGAPAAPTSACARACRSSAC